MKTLFKLLIIIVMYTGTLLTCKQRTTFEPGQCYSVQQLLNSPEAKVACDEKASFEGSTLCLTGLLEVSNDPRQVPANFFLQSPGNPHRAVEVLVTGEVAVKVAGQVRANRGARSRLIGTVEGFGHPGNPDCKRTFILTLANVADFKLD